MATDDTKETAYFTSYQKHVAAGKSAAQARALATRESGTTPKESWVGKLKGKVKKEMDRTQQVESQLKKSGLTQAQIDRLKGK
jgi:hypothetical protein